MIHSKSTLYPLAGSLAVNMMLTMGAGSFLININKSLATQKHTCGQRGSEVPPPHHTEDATDSN